VSYQIDLAEDARREVKTLPAYVRAQALNLFRELANTPRPDRSRELRGKPGIYRIWLAKTWRIVYFIDDENQVIIILRVRHKDEIDYPGIDAPDPPDQG
jgi:mRNA-degrading endonuclease RelE of RelBE toxin-antitoxin system